MSKTFLALLSIAFACANGGAQSLPQNVKSTQAMDQFSSVHDSLDRTVAGLLADTVQEMNIAPVGHGVLDVRPSVPTVVETDLKNVPTPATGNASAATRQLEQLRPWLDPILRSEGVPLDMAFVVVVESGGKADALSPKGARGLWQLMPDTARRYGLVVDAGRDERLDIEKSTHAAAQYLRDLYAQFKSWPVALAAYNAGEHAVRKAIDQTRSDEFAILSSRQVLPAETRSYVPAVIGLIERSGSADYYQGQKSKHSQNGRIVYAGAKY